MQLDDPGQSRVDPPLSLTHYRPPAQIPRRASTVGPAVRVAAALPLWGATRLAITAAAADGGGFTGPNVHAMPSAVVLAVATSIAWPRRVRIRTPESIPTGPTVKPVATPTIERISGGPQ